MKHPLIRLFIPVFSSFFFFIFFAALTLPVFGQGIITTFAGGGPANGSPATSVALGCDGCFVAANGSWVYISTPSQVFKVNTSDEIFAFAGSGLQGFSGDGGPAINAEVFQAAGVGFDHRGNLYLADQWNNRVRKVDTSGIITTVAGNGGQGFSGDGGLAVDAELNVPLGVTVDSAGNLYIADTGNNRVRKVDPSGIISTVAGNGTQGFSGDGAPAVNAELDGPAGLAVESGNLYIADQGNQRIRKVDPASIISTVAGDGTQGFSGDGGPAINAELGAPAGVTVHGGNFYIADTFNQRIRKVNPSGIISTIAGNGTPGFSGDGGPAISAMISYPGSLGFDSKGNLYVGDDGNQRVRKIDSNGIISTFAGNGQEFFSGDGGPAVDAQLYTFSVAVDGNGNTYIADTINQRIRKVDISGIISTVAGNGETGYSGDGGPAIDAALNKPLGIAVDGSGNLYIADSANCLIRKVDSSGDISTVAGRIVQGRGVCGFYGDGGPAKGAKLHNPSGVAVDGNGNIYINDTNNQRIRKVDPSGNISTIVKVRGLFGVYGVAVDSAGNVYVADSGHYQLLKLDTAGTLSIVAGNGKRGFAGDGGPATSAELSSLAGVAVDSVGNIYISDSYPSMLGSPGTGEPENDRVRKVDSSGIISTVAGNGILGFSGDGGPATDAELDWPNGLAVDSDGNLYIADSQRVRKVTAPPARDHDDRK